MLIIPDEHEAELLKWLQDYGDYIEHHPKTVDDAERVRLGGIQEKLEMFISNAEDGSYTWEFTPVQVNFWAALIVMAGKYLSYLTARRANRSERKETEVMLGRLRRIHFHAFQSADVAGLLEVVNDESE